MGGPACGCVAPMRVPPRMGQDSSRAPGWRTRSNLSRLSAGIAQILIACIRSGIYEVIIRV